MRRSLHGAVARTVSDTLHSIQVTRAGAYVSLDHCLARCKCTKPGQLILSRIIKTVATRCQILRLKCTKIDFGWGSAPDPAGGAYSAPPDPLAGFKGAYI